jgi:hypothetical protein
MQQRYACHDVAAAVAVPGHERRYDRSQRSVRRDLGGSVEIDATDGDQGYASDPARLGGTKKAPDTHDWIGIDLAPCGVYRSVGDVVGARVERFTKLSFVVRRNAHPQAGREAADVSNVEIRLTDVDPLATGEHREIRPVVGEERDARGVAARVKDPEPGKDVSRRRPLGPELHDCRPSRDDALGKGNEWNPRGLEQIGVDDGIKPAHFGPA